MVQMNALKRLLPNHSLGIVKEASMSPTLDDGHLVLTRAAKKPPGRGCIVVAEVPLPSSGIHVKRVVGLPGERVAFEDSSLFINDEFYPEAYLGGLPQTVGLERGEWKLGPDEYFLLGDNRSRSVDSRRYGPVKGGAILATVWMRLWPVTGGFRVR